MGILGPNGAGKSTLLDVIAGVLPASRGKVDLRGALAYVPQRDSINWRFPVTVMDVVTLGRSGANPLRRPGRQDRELVHQSIDRVGLWDRRSSLMTELSGGQRQRVFIARALAQQANIILLDEAFSGVDVGAQQEIVDVLRTLRDDGCIILLATHGPFQPGGALRHGVMPPLPRLRLGTACGGIYRGSAAGVIRNARNEFRPRSLARTEHVARPQSRDFGTPDKRLT